MVLLKKPAVVILPLAGLLQVPDCWICMDKQVLITKHSIIDNGNMLGLIVIMFNMLNVFGCGR